MEKKEWEKKKTPYEPENQTVAPKNSSKRGQLVIGIFWETNLLKEFQKAFVLNLEKIFQKLRPVEYRYRHKYSFEQIAKTCSGDQDYYVPQLILLH